MKIIVRWRPLALVGLALLGLALRLYGLNWDQGNSFHPDERQILFHVMALSWPHSFAQFLDPVNSPLNPHFFAYGTFPLYLLAIVGNLLSHINPEVTTMANLTLVGRVLSAIFDGGTILLTGWLGLLLTDDDTPARNRAWAVAFLAAALVTFTPLQLQLSHFFVVDTVLLFFVVLTILASVALVRTEALLRWSLIAGLAFGLAVATKVSAAPLIVPMVVACLLRWYKRGEFYTTLVSFLVQICVALAAFLIAMPYALLDETNFIQQIVDQGNLARGNLDLPYVRQFAGTVPYLNEAQNMFFWGMGVMLGLAVGGGILWLCWRVWKRSAGPWLIVLSWVLVYSAIVGDFYVKFMRYMLPVYPLLTLIAAAGLVAFARAVTARSSTASYRRVITVLPYLAIALVLGGTMFQGLALLNVYSQPNTRISASQWMYSHIKPGSVLTYEQWDDPLPVAVGNNQPGIYIQATYPDANGQPQTGLDLYGDDTTDKAKQLAKLLPTINAITMPTDRLDKSIPRLPFRYPLTIHYYQLLYSGQLGFHLAATFANHPNLFGITLDDSNADESYSVFDHPTAHIFVRDTPYPYTSDQLLQKLLQGVQLPPMGASLSGTQRSLLLTPQQIADDQQSPPFSVQFPADSVSNTVPVFVWWVAILLLGLLAYPLTFAILRGLADRGYIFSKLLGVLLLAYVAWFLASVHLLAFSGLSIWLIVVGLLLCSLALGLWQRQRLWAFLRSHWRLLLLEEGIFTLAFLLFVGIRSLNPDLWHIYLGGEKPMELAFLNAVLRSSYMPPYDPWFSGGYINYYYYGYVIWGTIIKLTGIVPTTAFNLTIPTLFALTFTGVVSLLYSLTRRWWVALLGGYFAALIGNFDGLIQLKGQIAASLVHLQPPAFSYWQSSRLIPFTINEFPFWSFLFADLHPHVMDLPIAVFMLGIAATFFLPVTENGTLAERRWERYGRYLLAAFVFGTIACVNTWDMPVYALVLGIVLLVQTVQQKRQAGKLELCLALGFSAVTFGLLFGLGYLFYWPFYSSYQQLYVNGLGFVTLGTTLSDYLVVFGLWLFLALSFFLLELYRWWAARSSKRHEPRRIIGFLLLSGVALTFITLLGLKTLLVALIALGIVLFVLWESRKGAKDSAVSFAYLLLLLGLCITLGQEIVYIRDFLDGGDYERMNTVFKFSMQAWLCFAIGGAIAVRQMWTWLSGLLRHAWTVILVVLVVACSIFLTEGTASRIDDHAQWAALAGPPVTQNANYTPTLDGFAFARAFYPADAQAITWLNNNVSGCPVVLEATAPTSYQWFNRVSVYTGLPDVLGWSDHVSEQRYGEQSLNRTGDINIMYSTTDTALALELLHYYHVRYIYVGLLEQQLYANQSANGLHKFDAMVGSSLRVVYRANGVTIYEVV